MSDEHVSTSNAVVEAPKPLTSMLAAVKATLSGEQAQTTLAAEQKAQPESVEQAKQDKPSIEVVGKEKKGRFIQSGEPKSETVKDEPAKADTAKDESHGIKQLREQYERTKQEFSAAKEELAKLKGQLNPEEYKVAKEELERLKSERQELLDAIKASDVTKHPDFKREVEAPLKAAESRLLQYVPDNLKGTIKWLAEQPASAQRLNALEQAVSELSPIAQSAIVNAVESYTDLVARRDAVIANSKQFAEQLEQRRNADVQRRQQEERSVIDRHIADALQAASEEIPLFRDKDGDDAWNAEVRGRRESVKKLLTTETDPSRLAEAAVFAEYGRKAISLLPKAQAEIERLSKELDSLKSARPMAPKQGTATQGTDKPKNFAEAMKAAMAGTFTG